MNRRQTESKGLLASLSRGAKEENERSAVRIIVAVTGASGSIYARQLLEGLIQLRITNYELRFDGEGDANRRSLGADAAAIAAEEGTSERGDVNFSHRHREDGVVRADRIPPRQGADKAETTPPIYTPQIERIGLIVSRRGAEVAEWEGVALPEDSRIERFDNDDMFSSPASGSARWDAMVIVPASMGCVGRIAAGVSSDLIARAADVMLKEGRTLIVVPRETPLNLIHLRNLTTLAEAGAVVLPASPSFYSRPTDIEAACATVTERILGRLGVDFPHYEWGER